MKSFLLSALFVCASTSSLFAHCEIPCGIYDDYARVVAMMEDVTTLKKSVDQIIAESAKDKPNYNQLVRWVMNKEKHADHISEVIHTYFLTQRIKSSKDDYKDQLVAAHTVIVLAMKTKQTADPKVVEELEAAVKAFGKYYPEPDPNHKH